MIKVKVIVSEKLGYICKLQQPYNRASKNISNGAVKPKCQNLNLTCDMDLMAMDHFLSLSLSLYLTEAFGSVKFGREAHNVKYTSNLAIGLERF